MDATRKGAITNTLRIRKESSVRSKIVVRVIAVLLNPSPYQGISLQLASQEDNQLHIADKRVV
jgi:hypothetical protein